MNLKTIVFIVMIIRTVCDFKNYLFINVMICVQSMNLKTIVCINIIRIHINIKTPKVFTNCMIVNILYQHEY